MSKKSGLTLAIAFSAAVLCGAGVASSQPTPAPTAKPTPAASVGGLLQNTYYTTAAPDSTIRVVNNSGATLCALIYVIDQDQEMKECCGCPITDGGTKTLSLATDLTSNPANGVATSTGSLSIISSASAACDAGSPKATPQLEAVTTHPQSTGMLTEEEFTPIQLTTAGLASLTAGCKAIELVGSGKGVCTCGTGG